MKKKMMKKKMMKKKKMTKKNDGEKVTGITENLETHTKTEKIN
jgi:hypothetical protein